MLPTKLRGKTIDTILISGLIYLRRAGYHLKGIRVMTRKTFYQKLRKAAPKFKWVVEYGDIRGYCGEDSYCPVTAVALTELEEDYSTGSVDIAASRLGISSDDMARIVNSADDADGSGSWDSSTRMALARAVGISKEEAFS
jgi:hypothetical protein